MIAPPASVDSARSAPHSSPVQPAIVCLSHLRWDFVYQRPQHLLGRAARDRRVFFVEEPVFDTESPFMESGDRPEGVTVAVPHVPPGLSGEQTDATVRALLDGLLQAGNVDRYVLWFYTPMALGFASHLRPLATVYDVMDELSLFRGAPPLLVDREAELFTRSDVIFTGGASLYEAKRHRHSNVHLFPSSIDAEHFAVARQDLDDPLDQREIPGPRLGFFGVIDERMDTGLIAAVADARPDWQIVMVGPVVKIDPAELPDRPNIHYLGPRNYAELPRYIAGWDVALMPWALNESTRFISPTKTPEYLAAGRPVVSTAVHDVVQPYGAEALVRIASSAREFVEAIEGALLQGAAERAAWLERVDGRLATTSWDRTWAEMDSQIAAVLQERASNEATVVLQGTGARPRQHIHPERATVAAD